MSEATSRVTSKTVPRLCIARYRRLDHDSLEPRPGAEGLPINQSHDKTLGTWICERPLSRAKCGTEG